LYSQLLEYYSFQLSKEDPEHRTAKNHVSNLMATSKDYILKIKHKVDKSQAWKPIATGKLKMEQ